MDILTLSEVRLRYMEGAARALHHSAIRTSAYLGATYESSAENITRKVPAIGNILTCQTCGGTCRIAEQPSASSKKPLRKDRIASDKRSGKISLQCSLCHSFAPIELRKARKPRAQGPPLGIRPIQQSARTGSSDITEAVTDRKPIANRSEMPAKKRAKNRKVGLLELLKTNSAQRTASQGTGLDITDFMKM